MKYIVTWIVVLTQQGSSPSSNDYTFPLLWSKTTYENKADTFTNKYLAVKFYMAKQNEYVSQFDTTFGGMKVIKKGLGRPHIQQVRLIEDSSALKK